MSQRFSSSLLLLVERYLSHLQCRGLATGTIEQRRIALRFFVAWLFAEGITDARFTVPAHIAAYCRFLKAYRHRRRKAAVVTLQPLSPKTRYDRLAFVRHFFAWLVREKVLLLSPFHDAEPSISLRHPPRSLPRRALTEREVLSLFAAIETASLVGIRNRAILEVLYGSGLRRAEVVDLNVSDLDLTLCTALVRRGKGGRSRVVPLGEPAVEALVRYLRKARPRWLGRRETQALFLASTTGRRLSKASIGMIVRAIGKAAGLRGNVTPHSLRHACATHMLRAGADIRHIQELLGHADIGTTEIYAHVVIKDLVEVHARRHPRGRRRRRSKSSEEERAGSHCAVGLSGQPGKP